MGALTNIPQTMIDWAKGSTRAAGQCAGFAGNDFYNAMFGGLKTYNSFLEAWADSPNRHPGEQPPEGILVYCVWQGASGDLKKYGHGALCVRYQGVTHKLMDSAQCTTWLNAKRTVGLRDATYPATYLGWMPAYGRNADITGLFQPVAAPPPPAPAETTPPTSVPTPDPVPAAPTLQQLLDAVNTLAASEQLILDKLAAIPQMAWPPFDGTITLTPKA